MKTFKNTKTGQRFRVGSLVSWTYNVSVAEMSFESENEGTIKRVDYINRCIEVTDFNNCLATIGNNFEVLTF